MHTSLQAQQDIIIIIAILKKEFKKQHYLINQKSTLYLNKYWI